MWISTRAFHVPKHGNAESEYEDAFFPPDGSNRELPQFRCAVADGASESAFARPWAQLLVRGFGRRQMHLVRLRQLWQKVVGESPLPWYLENKVLDGAHAAFLGLAIRDGTPNGQVATPAEVVPPGGPDAPTRSKPANKSAAKTAKKPAARTAKKRAAKVAKKLTAKSAKKLTGKAAKKQTAKAAKRPAAKAAKKRAAALPGGAKGSGGAWRALAVGDCCIFQVRGKELVTSGPLSRSDEFGNRPFLIPSRSPEPIRRGNDHVFVLSGSWQPRDIFYLATDALARWVMVELEAGRSPWRTLHALERNKRSRKFARLVADLRAKQALHNDDTTLLRVEVA